MSKKHFHFRDLTDTLNYIEVCKVTCNPDGTFEVPSEKDGRVVQISAKTRKALGEFLHGFADRLAASADTPVAPRKPRASARK